MDVAGKGRSFGASHRAYDKVRPGRPGFSSRGGELPGPLVPFNPLLGGSPTKIGYRQKGILILTFLLKDLDLKFGGRPAERLFIKLRGVFTIRELQLLGSCRLLRVGCCVTSCAGFSRSRLLNKSWLKSVAKYKGVSSFAFLLFVLQSSRRLRVGRRHSRRLAGHCEYVGLF